MPRRILTIGVAIVLVVMVLAASHVEEVDDGFIISYGFGTMDLVGETKLAYARATRDCSQVTRLNTQEMSVLLNDAVIREKFKKQAVELRAGWQLGDWMLIETDFDNAEPAVLLLKKSPNALEIASAYGGTAVPFNDTQVIHEHFLGMRPDAPRNLVLCYEPVGGPFNRAS